jgi:hypothetical protein
MSDYTTDARWVENQRVLLGAKGEVEEMQALIESGEHDSAFAYYERLLDQLVPYADAMARIEGHRDAQLVLERELDL